jgi:hypothetical protein
MLKWAARAHVIDELMAEAINVALPVGACDIDILAFLESRTEPCGLVSVPIQIVVSRGDALSRNLQAARVLGVLVALVWDIGGVGADTKLRLDLGRTHLGQDDRSHGRCTRGSRICGSGVRAGAARDRPAQCHEAVCDVSRPMAQETPRNCRRKAGNRALLPTSLIPDATYIQSVRPAAREAAPRGVRRPVHPQLTPSEA